MARSVIGLDIGTSAVRAAEIVAGSPPTMVRFAQVALPAGAVSDGEVHDRGEVAAAIRRLWREGGFSRKRVATAVSNQKVVVRQVELPWMDEEELRGALRFQVQEYIPIPIEDAIVDFQVMEEFTGDDGARMQRVLVVAAVREMVDGIVSSIDAAGLQPESIDYAGFAAMRAVVADASLLGEREAEAVLDIGAGVTNVIVHEGGEPRFVRILPSGGSDITEALVAELGMAADEAERAKVDVGVPRDPGAGDGAARVIDRRAQSFIDDVRSSLEYFQASPGAPPLARVLVIGGGSLLPNLVERLQSALRLPVEEGHPLSRVKVGNLRFTPEQLAHVSAVAGVAVGLAMEDE